MRGFPATNRRVKENTDLWANQRINEVTRMNIENMRSANRGTINRRLLELDYEWDTERVLETGAGVLMVYTSIMAMFGRRRCLVMGTLVGGSLLMHALQGWCPPLPIIRRMGVRTAAEIHDEQTALRQLRGDFDEDNLARMT